MFAQKLSAGDEIRIVAPARSLSAIRPNILETATQKLIQQGFKVSFSENCNKVTRNESADVAARVKDLHQAFLDSQVKAILACIGGFNSNQLLEYIDYSIIKRHPKILCGFSDITALLHAVYTKTGLVTYYGPNLCSFGHTVESNYTAGYFGKCLCGRSAYNLSPSTRAKNYYTVQPGQCEGKIIGGNLCTLNLLQGTQFMPDLNGAVLFLEDDNIMGEYFPFEFERNLQSLLQQKGAENLKGIVFGRFEPGCNTDLSFFKEITASKPQLQNIPIVFNVDFGHVSPISTFPIGGQVSVYAAEQTVKINILKH